MLIKSILLLPGVYEVTVFSTYIDIGMSPEFSQKGGEQAVFQLLARLYPNRPDEKVIDSVSMEHGKDHDTSKRDSDHPTLNNVG